MRTLTTTFENAIDLPGTYFPLVKATAWKSRIFFDTITSDFAIATGADTIGMQDDPLPQEIEYNAAQGLVTFFTDGSKLCYAVQGSSTVNTTAVDCTCKPGVLGDVVYVFDGSNIKRYGITWAGMSFSSEATVATAQTIVALHALSATECVAVCDDDGGFRILYISGTTIYTSTGRFMFPKFTDWDDSSRTMADLGLFSCAAKLGQNIFAYASRANDGQVDGMCYDLDTGVWSDTFIILPTDLETSLCEFRIANGGTRNDWVYIVGHFRRTDAYAGDQPYSIIIRSADGKHFSIDRFSLVSNIGYRFLGRVGSDNKLYLANSNRVCYSSVTWVFDGSGANGLSTQVTGADIVAYRDDNLQSATLTLAAGNEVYMSDQNLMEGSKIDVYTGLRTTAGDEWTLYGTYIIDSIDESYSDGSRSLTYNLMNLSGWMLTGLSMPFYAEVLGKSTLFEPMMIESGKMYAAGNTALTQTYFDIDFWNQEPYTNSTASITGISMMDGGGVRWKDYASTFKYGVINKDEVKDILLIRENPLITASPLTINLHGWSTCNNSSAGPTANVVLILCDEDGTNEETVITTESDVWPYPWDAAKSGGTQPIVLSASVTPGKYIKKVGIVFEYAGASTFTRINIARAEFTNNVEVLVSASDENAMWEVTGQGTWKLPRPGRPYIMFGQKPYNAYNFHLVGAFTNTVTGGISGYSVGPGLVGHAEDALNYTCGRYNDVDNRCEVVKCRHGIETVLGYATPGFTVDSDQRILFSHKDGTFTISMYNASNTRFEQVLSYDWKAADGFMYTSKTTTRKCGIYGKIGVPWFKSCGLWKADSDDSNTSDGIGINPLDSTTDFPASGTVRLDDNTYTYASIISKPSPVRGPYQFRQMGKYDEPYGNGSYGMEVYDCDDQAATDLLDGYIAAVDSGANYIINEALWQVWITTDGSPVDIPGRARYYSANESIGRVYHTLGNRVWVTGGLSTITLVSGESLRHAAGTNCFLELEGEITCSYFMGAGGPDQITLVDLITSVCAFSGAQVQFSGDKSYPSVSVTTGTTIQRDYYCDGFQVSWETASEQSFSLNMNIKIDPEKYDNKAAIESDTSITIDITSLGSGDFVLTCLSSPSDTSMFSVKYNTGTSKQKYSLAFHSNNFTLYQNGKWVATVPFEKLIYNQTTYVDVLASGSLTFSNVLYRELADWREAVYIDLETDGMSAIGSLVQERPVEMYSCPDGKLDMFYQKVYDTVTGVIQARNIGVHRQLPREGCSDAIIYSMKEVVTIQHTGFGKDLGFATRLIKQPNMEAGAIEATQILLGRLYSARKQTGITIRPDFRVVIGDLYDYSYTLSGTGKVVSGTIYVEGCSLSISSSGNSIDSTMILRGRMND